MGKQVLKGIHKFRHIEVVPGGASYGFGTYNTLGRTYFVNNITGSSTGGGTTWDTATDEISTAITASEVYRQDRGSVSTNDYIRNTIVVQATGTAYSAVSTLPSYTDIIGLGATTRGNGTGIVRIDGGGADAMAGTARGLGLYNLQCMQSSAVSFYGLDLATCFRSTIESCGFVNNGSGGIRVVQGGSIVMNDVHCGHDTYAQLYGLYVAGGANFNACLITDSDFWGDTAGVLMSNTSGKETIIKNCFAGGGTYGFQDTSPSDMPHMVHYIKCYGKGTASTTINSAGFKLTNVYTERAIGCIENCNGTLRNYPSTAD
ncbi:hypothetical protein LCGC14_2414400 [marine sediment metagenome]|uniref:Right handed beta helix domain-containing protein n=1 Tax=marine sediment metagenome TaxID=412755 RepID=A0A0F9E3P6_9ZZZZ